ncbi:MAG: protein kinase, partial [Acidobacteriota bacterium]
MKTFWIGEWRVEPTLNRIERGEETRHLEPRAMDLLVYLADHAGEVLSKDRLIRAVWSESFVSDGAATYGIAQLRQLLEDDARQPRFIETIPRRGYRLIAEVTFEEAAGEESHYELLERLGQGGMGEVFLARDRILNRRVALKFLQPEKEKDELWLRRLMREARAAAALDHPYICKVYETGRFQGRDFIAMEYVEGEKLSRRIERGPLPLEEALRIGLEIAEALECAHGKGIVHRDVKPSNIILTGQGHVKITDFGIAKRFRRDEGEQEEGTLTDTAEASPGTPDYMSPEQIRGETLDQRSDLFQLGMVLYEMLTGAHPFRKATRPETTAAILNDEPSRVRESRVQVPDRLEELVRQLLAKNTDQRPPSVCDVQAELREALAIPAKASPAARTLRLSWSALGLLAIALALVGVTLWWSPWRSESVPTAPLRIIPFTSEGGRKSAPRFSPDGERVAYAWWGGPGGSNVDLFVKSLTPDSTPLRLTEDPAGDFLPAWSRDGRRIAFTRVFTNGTAAIYLIPSMGGRERKLIDVEGAIMMVGGYVVPVVSWSPLADELVFSEARTPQGPARVVRLSIETLRKELLTDPPEGTFGDLQPEFSPDGRDIAFFRAASDVFGKVDVWVMRADGWAARRLTELEFDFANFRPTWTVDGRAILFVRGQINVASAQVLRVDVE